MRDEDAPAVLPSRYQPLLAALVFLWLVAMAAWFVAAGGLTGGLVHHDAPPAPTVRYTVNINAAGSRELAELPGLGPATAERIVAWRREHGPFSRLDDLLDVPGIGPATLARMLPHLRPPGRARRTP